jgi:hypothetical protein
METWKLDRCESLTLTNSRARSSLISPKADEYRLWYNHHRLVKRSAVNNVMTHANINGATSAPLEDAPRERLYQIEIAKRGQDIYDRSIRAQVETRANMGKIISIDIETGNYEIDDNLLESSDRLQNQFPDAMIWAERIGFNAVYAVGGTLTKVDLS